MADVMDIMNLKEAAAARPSEAAQIMNSLKKVEPQKPKKERKPEGISRELYSLIGGLPSVVPADQGFKEKPNLGHVKATEWKWAPFHNPARTDNFQLCHWVKADEANNEYPFAKFGKKTQLLRYTDEEYQAHFENPAWTREETDTLFDLCEKFDLRFAVVYDRMETEKSLEDLKERYYTITKKLMEMKNGIPDPADPNSKAYLEELAKYDLDKAREIERKAQLDALHKRTPEQVKEEEYLMIELRKLEQNSKKLLRDREHVIKLLNTIDSAYPLKKFYPQKRPAPDSASKMGMKPPAVVESLEPLKKKKRLSKTFSEEGGPVTPSHNSLTDHSVEASPVSSVKKKEKMPPGPSLRSIRLLAPVSIAAKTAKRIDQFFEELGIPVRPTMPTNTVCQVFEDIRNDIILLLDLKRNVDKKEHEVKVLESRKAQLEQALKDKGKK